MKKYFTLSRVFFVLVSTVILSCVFSDLLAAQVITAVSLAFSPAAIISERKLFDKLKKDYVKKSVIPSPSFLRIEQTLSNSSGKYLFDIKKNGNEIATERKLDRNDLFVCTRLGFYLTKQNSTTIGLEVPQTWANVYHFTTALTALNCAHLETLYAGYMSLKTGQKVNIEALSMYNFRYVQTGQADSGSVVNEFNVSEYTYAGSEDIYLHGTKSHEITVEFPTFAAMAIQTTLSNTLIKLVFIPFGFLLKNCADGI
jgi:hypothetical protein